MRKLLSGETLRTGGGYTNVVSDLGPNRKKREKGCTEGGGGGRLEVCPTEHFRERTSRYGGPKDPRHK